RFVFVPGLFYESRPENKADMEHLRRALRDHGLETHFVPTGDRSSVEQGAKVLADYLRTATDRPIILFSASKGSADVALALSGPGDFDHVHGWISIGGVLRGTPLADVGLRWPNNIALGLGGWWHGTTIGVASDLTTKRGAARAATYAIPDHVRILHFLAVPFSGSITPRVRANYNAMRRYGPNDGVGLLTDQLLPQGYAVLAIGVDHHFEGLDVERGTLALTNLVLELVRSASPAPASG
ncbi:MAG: hypothetical protein ACYTHK_13690, partial [Planctomycetota bacterium]